MTHPRGACGRRPPSRPRTPAPRPPPAYSWQLELSNHEGREEHKGHEGDEPRRARRTPRRVGDPLNLRPTNAQLPPFSQASTASWYPPCSAWFVSACFVFFVFFV